MDPNEGLTGTAGIPLSLSASLTYWLKYNLYEIDHSFFFGACLIKNDFFTNFVCFPKIYLIFFFQQYLECISDTCWFQAAEFHNSFWFSTMKL